MSKHTPAPWAFRLDADDIHGAFVTGGGHVVADMVGVSQNRIANARLIAAAPELLEALEAIFASYKALADSGDAGFWQLENLPEGKQALAAIAKATASPHSAEQEKGE